MLASPFVILNLWIPRLLFCLGITWKSYSTGMCHVMTSVNNWPCIQWWSCGSQTVGHNQPTTINHSRWLWCSKAFWFLTSCHKAFWSTTSLHSRILAHLQMHLTMRLGELVLVINTYLYCFILFFQSCLFDLFWMFSIFSKKKFSASCLTIRSLLLYFKIADRQYFVICVKNFRRK